jgi:hypothetical protein
LSGDNAIVGCTVEFPVKFDKYEPNILHRNSNADDIYTVCCIETRCISAI